MGRIIWRDFLSKLLILKNGEGGGYPIVEPEVASDTKGNTSSGTSSADQALFTRSEDWPFLLYYPHANERKRVCKKRAG